MSGEAERATSRSREACYEARDAYYACKDLVSQETATSVAAPASEQCKDQAAAYQSQCLRSWRKYWDERRANDLVLRKPALGK